MEDMQIPNRLLHTLIALSSKFVVGQIEDEHVCRYMRPPCSTFPSA